MDILIHTLIYHLHGIKLLLEKSIIIQIDRQVFAFYGIRIGFQCSKEPYKSIDIMFLILSSHLRLDLPNGFLSLGSHACCMSPHFTLLDFIIVTAFVEGCRLWNSSCAFFWSFLSFPLSQVDIFSSAHASHTKSICFPSVDRPHAEHGCLRHGNTCSLPLH